MSDLFTILVLLFFAGVIGWLIYWKFDHGYCSDKSRLDPNAAVVSMDSKYSEMMGGFRTTVTFSDGFRYVTYKTKTERVSLRKFNKIVSQEMKQEILQKAWNLHQQWVAKYR